MTHPPLVSVLISNHNYARWVGGSIQSALAQTYPKIEVIVCDDGSTDDSVEVLKGFDGDPRLRVLTQGNQGQGSALSRAASEARGEIICFLDADDAFMPTKVQEVVDAFASSPAAGLALHRVVVTDEKGRAVQEIPQFASLRGGDLRHEVLRRGGRWVTAPSSALSLHSRYKGTVFPIPPALRTGADAFVFTLMPLVANVVVLDRPLSRYGVHGANAYGTTTVDLATAEYALREIELVTEMVNQRLEALGSDVSLDVERNLYWHQQRANVALLGRASRVESLTASREFVSRLRPDDLWPPFVRGALWFLYATARLLPRGFRARWLNLGLGLSRAKRVVGRMMRR